MTNRKALFFFILLQALLLLAGCLYTADQGLRLEESVRDIEADAREVPVLKSEIKRIEDKTNRLEKDLRGNGADRKAALDSVRDELRSLGNRVSEIEDYGRDLERRHEEALVRLSLLERLVKARSRLAPPAPGALPPVSSTPAAAAPVEPVAVKTPEPVLAPDEKALAEAETLFDKGEFGKAGKKFRAFLADFPKSPRRSRAQFRLGEIHFIKKRYAEAILAFYKVVDGYPKSPEAPAALLKAGLASIEKGKVSDGRIFLEKLVREHPASKEAARAKKKLATLPSD